MHVRKKLGRKTCLWEEPIPSQLAREYKKFSYSVVKKGGRGRDYAGSLQWIEDAEIIRRCYNIEKTELPLDGNKIPSEFKVYMADIGLLVSMLEMGMPSPCGLYSRTKKNTMWSKPWNWVTTMSVEAEKHSRCPCIWDFCFRGLTLLFELPRFPR